MNQDTLDLNIIAVPSDSVSSQVIRWSGHIARHYTTEFVLDGRTLHPHLTLYQSRFPKSNWNDIVASLSTIARSSESMQIGLSGFSSFAGVVFWDASKTNELVAVHLRVATVLSPLRNGHLLPVHEELLNADISESKKECIRQWGNPMSMDEFDPHITITRLVNHAEAEDAICLLEPISSQFTVTELVASTVGPHGTCTGMLDRFRIPA